MKLYEKLIKYYIYISIFVESHDYSNYSLIPQGRFSLKSSFVIKYHGLTVIEIA